MEESSKRNPDDEEANQEGMPTIFSKLFNQRDVTIENYKEVIQHMIESKRTRRAIKDTIEICRELEKHWENTRERFEDVGLEETININELLKSTPWTSRLKPI